MDKLRKERKNIKWKCLKIIEKINYFTKLSRERELTPEEQAERAEYRKMYLELFKAQVKRSSW